MIRDITIGQYYSGESVIHRLDARLKIVATVLFIIELFVVNDFIGFALCAVCLGIVVSASKVPLNFIMRGMKPILLILIFTFCLNIFMIPGNELVRIGFLKITDAGLYTAVFMAIRLVLLIVGTSLLTFTTKPINLTDGIESLLGPLGKIGVPTHELAMMMSIALRFIPTLLEETDKIIKAQQARGADFESGNLIRRAKALVPILVPLFVSAFRIAQDLAMAMEARCYKGGKGRTRLHQMKFGKIDYMASVILVLFLAAVICMRIFF
ncbi:MAG: energy-coupling factor transporter transmembrane protein EcfT [Firmicutes bacterium]|nr:energy-coupling factor transporter transmembrane protein EcfT [Bacillota bacterium]